MQKGKIWEYRKKLQAIKEVKKEAETSRPSNFSSKKIVASFDDDMNISISFLKPYLDGVIQTVPADMTFKENEWVELEAFVDWIDSNFFGKMQALKDQLAQQKQSYEELLKKHSGIREE